MWDHGAFDDTEDDWEPLRKRRARPIRILAILVVTAMVLALVIPALLRLLQDDEPDETRPDGVRASLVLERPAFPSSLVLRKGIVSGLTSELLEAKELARPSARRQPLL